MPIKPIRPANVPPIEDPSLPKVGPSLENEMELQTPPNQNKPGKKPGKGFESPTDAAGRARKNNPVTAPSSAAGDIDSPKNAPAAGNPNNDATASWTGYVNPWISRGA